MPKASSGQSCWDLLAPDARTALSRLADPKYAGTTEFFCNQRTPAELWESAPRFEWLLVALDTLRDYVARPPSEHDFRLFACCCAELMGGADPVVKLVLRGDLKASCLTRRYVVLARAVPGAMNHANGATAAHVVARAEAANPDVLAGAMAAGHCLAVYMGARPMQRPQWRSVSGRRLERPNTDPPLVPPAEAVVHERTIVALLRVFLGAPFTGVVPSPSPEAVSQLQALPPPRQPVSIDQRVAPPSRAESFEHPSKNRILLDEDNTWAIENIILRRLGTTSYRLYWRSFIDEEEPSRWWTPFESGPIRSGEDFLREADALAEKVGTRWEVDIDRMVAQVHTLDPDFGCEVERAWTRRAANKAKRDFEEAIHDLASELIEYGADDPTNWGITRDRRVEPLALAEGLALSQLVALSGATVKDGKVPGAWFPLVRDWLNGFPVGQG